jgi:hypothetical protein
MNSEKCLALSSARWRHRGAINCGVTFAEWPGFPIVRVVRIAITDTSVDNELVVPRSTFPTPPISAKPHPKQAISVSAQRAVCGAGRGWRQAAGPCWRWRWGGGAMVAMMPPRSAADEDLLLHGP